MQILKSTDELKTYRNLAVSIGSFDGVHRGHIEIFNVLKAKAKETDGESMIITFDPHPQLRLHPDTDFFQITPTKEKLQLLQKQNVDYILIIPFTHQFAATSFTDFFQNFLIEKLRIRSLVMGTNHSIGKNREGRTNSIKSMCERNGVDVVVVPELIIDGQPVRSSEIRKLIHKMDIDKASQLLGRNL
ncbi:FAD synthetase family protein [Bacteroidales bacterium OttesenSCG-928-C03]|nr:FAD synthetase family protein [Bacteroidales bacterium OttesenSCG-928-C03]MDL2325949.1 FAD synthetase family protein [Bacteroidales bacterium OttesenSCG-928-A14]